ncbi:zf-HC2 domain-containing protein [Amycolatopsis lurida]
MADPYREWDVAYMLGSLSPAERREYELHLSGCEGCASEVTALAGLPGIMSAVPREQAAGLLAEDRPVRPAMPPAPRVSGRRGWTTTALAGAAILVVMVLRRRGRAARRRSAGTA